MTDTLAASNLLHSCAAAGASAEKAADKKTDKYATLAATHIFQPIAFETLGPINSSGVEFIDDIGHRLQAVSGDLRAGSFLWQRLSCSVSMQCACSAPLRHFAMVNQTITFVFNLAFSPKAIYTWWAIKNYYFIIIW